ncbi:hypothetical protein [Demequina rhizosphaerae]|uniref:hypothetical protein n=1 Tax=Demequina rhizosphaerae TaxID=1638985 RepID=UPI0007802F47|nr:hypothetical protein [Demequina rhizosphaerae]
MRALRGAAVGEAGEWLRGRIGTWATVGGVAGTGFEAYARILHPVPARRLSWEDPGGGMVPRVVEEREWTWASVADAVGRVVHPQVQWHALAGDEEFVRLDDGWEIGPTRDGWLDPRLWAALVPHLLVDGGASTVTLGIWAGYSELHPGGRHVIIATRADDAGVDAGAGAAGRSGAGPSPDVPVLAADVVEAVARGELLEIPGMEGTGREYLMLSGALAELADPDWGFRTGIGWWGPFREPMPQYAWPADHGWLVASEIDWDSTIVAGSRGVVDAVLAEPALEAFEVGPDDRLDWDGDTVNPPRS